MPNPKSLSAPCQTRIPNPNVLPRTGCSAPLVCLSFPLPRACTYRMRAFEYKRIRMSEPQEDPKTRTIRRHKTNRCLSTPLQNCRCYSDSRLCVVTPLRLTTSLFFDVHHWSSRTLTLVSRACEFTSLDSRQASTWLPLPCHSMLRPPWMLRISRPPRQLPLSM